MYTLFFHIFYASHSYLFLFIPLFIHTSSHSYLFLFIPIPIHTYSYADLLFFLLTIYPKGARQRGQQSFTFYFRECRGRNALCADLCFLLTHILDMLLLPYVSDTFLYHRSSGMAP